MIENKYKKYIDLYILVWSITMLFHRISFINWAFSFFGITATVFCLLQILFPKRRVFFLIALISNVIFIFNQLDIFVVNHIFFEWLVNIIILLIVSYYYSKSRIEKSEFKKYHDEIWIISSSFVRKGLIILYFFVVLHKLNFDFFNPEISCGALFFDELLVQYNLNKLHALNNFYNLNILFFRRASIYFTLFSEILIPLLLLFKRTRGYGLLYGIIFHVILALYLHNGVFSFSALILCSYVCFFNTNTVNRFSELNKKKYFFLIIVLSFVFLVLYFLLGYFKSNDINFIAFGLAFFLSYALLYLYNFIIGFKDKVYIKSSNNNLSRNNYIIVFGIIITIINGFSPYLGLKTENTFSMFSNLKTENNKTNHLFIPNNLQVFSYQTRIATIKSTNIKRLKLYVDTNKLIVMFELIKIINSQEDDFELTFVCNNKLFKIKKVNGQVFNFSDLDLNQSYLELKFFKFRPIYKNKNFCQH
ncbi:MAG: hypothetical protein ABJK28_07540 [Algibacter sp.]